MEFEAVIQRISPVVHKIAYKLAVQAPYAGTGEDFCQEALTHLWVCFNRHELDGKTDSYILQGCYFYLKNYIRLHRKQTRCVSLQQPLYDENDECLVDDIKNPQSDFRDQLHARFLVETICNNGLTAREKEVITLWREHLDTREIGRRLGISHVRVVKLMAKIREKCRQYRDYA